MKIGRILLRMVVGGLFLGHGLQKIFGWFGGPGLDGTTAMMTNLKLEPARRNAIAASATEATGGALLVAGAATPVAATALIGVMVTAIRTVHFRNGLWNGNGGYEFNLVMIAALVYLVENGPGPASLDSALGCGCDHRSRGILALAAGAVGSAAVIEHGHRQATAQAVEPVADAAPGSESPAADQG